MALLMGCLEKMVNQPDVFEGCGMTVQAGSPKSFGGGSSGYAQLLQVVSSHHSSGSTGVGRGKGKVVWGRLDFSRVVPL
eukprot:scaffold211515_cov21-Tisochrysis_lutea.AAC.1